MGYHSFSLDPRTILGVGSNASLDEIQDAYRAKSKKHHPDLGGDEWAFRMVARAYEVLKTTAAVPATPSWHWRGAEVGVRGQTPDWSTIWNAPFSKPDFATTTPGRSDQETGEANANGVNRDETANTESEPKDTRSVIEPAEFRTVDVELIWTRFEKEGSGQLLSTQEGDDATLSVCMVISWPPHELINRAAEFRSTGETLHFVIQLFETLRGQSPVIAVRSRIEDGQFVGWLSYVDVLTAQDAFLHLRDTFRAGPDRQALYPR